MKTDSPAVEVLDLNCPHGSLKKVSFEIPRGSVYALLGANGSGKSTLLRALLNIHAPASGVIRVLGRESTSLEPGDWARLGYVSDNPSLPEYLTLVELIAYCRPQYPDWDDALCRRLQDQFALPGNRRLAGFSRGMKIKAALLVSLAYRPSLLILDEPFNGLDVVMRDELIQGLLELAGDGEFTVLLTSHDLEEIERLADRVGLLDRGTLHLSEPLDDLRERFRRVDIAVMGGARLPETLPDTCLLPEAGASHVRWIDSRYAGDAAVAETVARLFPPGTSFVTSPLSLREILITLIKALRLQPLNIP